MADESGEIAELRVRVEKLEARMGFLMKRLGVTTEEPPEWAASERVLLLVRQGDTKAAIKAYMEETGAGLKDAKTRIDAMSAR